MKKFLKSLGKNAKRFYKWLTGVLKHSWKASKKFSKKTSGKRVIKIISFIVALLVSLKLFAEFVIVFLIAADPLHFAKIVEIFTYINIFEIISYRDFYLMLFGGFVMDMVVLTLILWLALWAGWGKQYLRKDWFKLIGIFFFGLLFFIAGAYYALPGIVDAVDQYNYGHEHKHHDHYHYEYEWNGDWRGVPEPIILPNPTIQQIDWWY